MSGLADASPRDLIPGNPAAVQELAAALRTYAAGAAADSGRLRGVGDGPWVGEAADAFRAKLAELPDRLERGVEAFLTASRTLGSYADALREGQAKAAQAIELAQDAERVHAAWLREVKAYNAAVEAGAAPPDRPPDTSPGAAVMADAEKLVAQASGPVEDAAAKTAAVLRDGADQAPDTTSIFGDITRGVWNHYTQVWAGAAEATWGLGEFAWKSSIVYALVDPGGAVEHWTNLAGGLVWGAQHPVAFGKAVIDWETWATNPSRAIGHLVPDAILTAATAGAGGAGVAASRAASAASRLTRAADDVADIAEDMEDVADVAEDVEDVSGAARTPDHVESWTGEGELRLEPQENADADHFLARAHQTEPKLTNDVTSVASDVGGAEMVGLDSRLKDVDSLKRKLATELLDDPNMTAKEALADIKDSVRYTMQIPDGNYAPGVSRAAAELRFLGYENVTWKNFWGSDGYQGINSTWRDPSTGQTFEVQFHTRDSFDAKMTTHELYEAQRLPGTSADEAARLAREQQQIFNTVANPPGAQALRPN